MKKLIVMLLLLGCTPAWGADFYEDTKNVMFGVIAVGYRTSYNIEGANHQGMIETPLLAYGTLTLSPYLTTDSRLREIGCEFSFKLNNKFAFLAGIFHDSRYDGTGGVFFMAV